MFIACKFSNGTNQKGHGTKPPRACARDEGQQLGRAASPSGHSLSNIV